MTSAAISRIVPCSLSRELTDKSFRKPRITLVANQLPSFCGITLANLPRFA
jgi:hypothetical protein